MNSFHQTTKLQLISIYAVVSVYCLELSYIMDAYRARCGNKVCGPQRFDSTNEIVREYCPECICDDTCIIYKNCCPDHYFRFPLSCIEASLLDFNPYSNKTSIAMISHCPVSSDNTTKRKCEMSTSLLQKFQNTPVYSYKSGLTYRNIHCSVCHNESFQDIHQWKIEIKCAEFADFNFLSTYSEIFDYAEEKKCDIFYSSADIYGLHINICQDKSMLDKAMISKCNVSGTWKKYDADIDFACRIYENRFHFFKNIFCQLCNPPNDVAIGEVISKCNATGLWEVFSAELEKACFNNIQSPLTTPFKNIYCYLCNSNDRNRTHNMHFKELVYFIVEKMENQNEFVLQLKSLDLNLESIIESGTKYLKDTNLETLATKKTKIIQDKDFYDLNKTSIMLQYFAFTGSPVFCHNYSFFSRLSDCDCSDSCYFQSGCCVDKYFQKSTTCTDQQYSDQKNGYLVFDTCTKSMSRRLETLCSMSNITKFFTFLPIEIQIDKSYTHFKNIYCALCSDGLNQSDSQVLNSISMWDLHISCNVYLPPFFFLSFEDYFRVLQENGCSVKYKPSEYTNVYCEEREDKHCNVSGNWVHGDRDIKFACENVNMPRNFYKSKMSVFCAMCNPEQKYNVEYSDCNTTGLWENYDKDTEEYCLSLPNIEYLAPYKNKFCEICNNEEDTYTHILPTHSETFDDIVFITEFMPPTFRVIFELSNFKQSSKQKIQTPSCNASQILFLNKCRDIHCYPGRMHIDTRCTPLFQTTANLGYILYAGLKTSLVSDINDTMPFLESVGQSFKDFLKARLRLSFIDFETSIIYSNLYCPDSKPNKLDKGIEVFFLAYHKFFIHDSVNRSMTEETLVSLLGSTFNVTYDEFQQPFLIQRDENAFNLPTLVSRFQFTDKCYTKETPESYPGNSYVHSHVTHLLMCEQIELNYTEFNINLKNLQLTVISRKAVIEPDEYILISPRQARICIDRLQTLNASRNSFNSGDVWNIVAMVFTCISLLCLFLTFLTYCIFPSLRTLPGKNNMCLVFAIFCAQILFQFVELGTKSDIGCKIIGVLIHYFWLVTFGCLSVCSFHMYRVFTSKTGIRISETSRLVNYIIYSYGTPAIIVSLNIIVTSFSSVTSIGYGSRICFLDQPIAYVVTFAVPISLVCCTNIFFFIATTYKIAKRPKLKNDSQMNLNQIQFTVYVKLFSITGITWIFQIIDSFIPVSAFSTIVSLLNALQGVFIFVSYVCNKRVLSLYNKTRMSFRGYSRTRTSRRTASTVLNSSTL